MKNVSVRVFGVLLLLKTVKKRFITRFSNCLGNGCVRTKLTFNHIHGTNIYRHKDKHNLKKKQGGNND